MKVLVLSLVLLLQQKHDLDRIWPSVGAYRGTTVIDDRDLSDAQIQAITKTLKAAKEVSKCKDVESADSVLEKLTFERIELSSNHETVLVQAGPGCLRGGQGSNGAMWIFQLNRRGVTMLVSPAEDFGGYIYSVQTTASKGYRDIVRGWHLSASEASLAYFRFDGAQYRKLSQATARRDNNGKEGIVPAK